MTVFRPTSIAEAVSALARHPGLRVVAGGTDVMVGVRSGSITLTDVMTLRSMPELRAFVHDRGRAKVRIGAATTFAELAVAPFDALVPALAQSARALGSVQIRNAATIGGSLGTAAPNSDVLVVLAALDATVELASERGRRAVAAREFADGRRDTPVHADELITAVEIPTCTEAQHFAKVTPRAAMTGAVVNGAVVVERRDRVVRIALGGVAPTVVRIDAAETWCASAIDWDDPQPDPEVARAFGHRVSSELAPSDDERASGAYRSHAAGLLAARLLLRCLR
jgi:CO/xanthine dehydrogenase FAD-binding subunit